jgi:hypothetical protein
MSKIWIPSVSKIVGSILNLFKPKDIGISSSKIKGSWLYVWSDLYMSTWRLYFQWIMVSSVCLSSTKKGIIIISSNVTCFLHDTLKKEKLFTWCQTVEILYDSLI